MTDQTDEPQKLKIAIITAGGAGMFCGSCMQDNSLAAALIEQGHQVTLIPTYTPIRVDAADQTGSPIFLGGINVYLDHFVPIWRQMPGWSRRWLDHPHVIRFLTKFGISNDARQLGAMSVSLMKGEYGPHQRSIQEFVHWICHEVKPDVILFSNLLLGGIASTLRKNYSGPVLSLLQGDDLFLDGLIEPWRSEVMQLMNLNARHFDGFVSHSNYYLNYMREYLQLTHGSSHVIPLGIELNTQDVAADSHAQFSLEGPIRIGYFARIAPEKGLDILVEAVLKLKDEFPQLVLEVGGYLATHQREYWNSIRKLAEPLGSRFEYLGSPETAAQKAEIYRRWNLFSVPARFVEPKGISVLEAMSHGLPVVQPNTGAYPELLGSTGVGILVEPDDPDSLAEGIRELLTHELEIYQLGQQAREIVLSRHTNHHTATALIEHLRSITLKSASSVASQQQSR